MVQVERGERRRGHRQDGQVVERPEGGDAEGERLERAQIVAPARDRALRTEMQITNYQLADRVGEVTLKL